MRILGLSGVGGQVVLAGGPRGGDPADGSFRLPVSAVEGPAAAGEVETAPPASNSWLPLPTGDAVDPLRTLLLLLLGVKRLDPPRTSLLLLVPFLTANPFCKRLPLS
jgi:hypothetical protein